MQLRRQQSSSVPISTQPPARPPAVPLALTTTPPVPSLFWSPSVSLLRLASRPQTPLSSTGTVVRSRVSWARPTSSATTPPRACPSSPTSTRTWLATPPAAPPPSSLTTAMPPSTTTSPSSSPSTPALPPTLTSAAMAARTTRPLTPTASVRSASPCMLLQMPLVVTY